MADYKLFASDSVLRRADMACIPPDPLNADYAAYLAWVAAGCAPDPADPAVEPVPASISDRQFFQQLAVEGTITNAEALAAVKIGTIPAVLQTFVDAIPDLDERFSVNMLLAGATVFERLHPMSEAIRIAQGRTERQRDEFFTAAAAL